MISHDFKEALDGIAFADLFAGIGGFRYALESFGAKCVFSSEKNSAAKKTYLANHGELPAGDITKIAVEEIPGMEILCGGFPCQSFSVAGNRKGFEDIRGTLFFDIVRIAAHHQPRLIFLENVKNLTIHDGGRTMARVVGALAEIGYSVHHSVLCASHYGVPHARERIFILAFRNDVAPFEFSFPSRTNQDVALEDILVPDAEAAEFEIDVSGRVVEFAIEPQFRLSLPYKIAKVGLGRQGERVYHPKGHAITLSAGGGNIGGMTGLYYVNRKIRKLAPLECGRLMGFPDSFIRHKSVPQSYRHFGNSVVIDVLQHILISVVKQVKSFDLTYG